VAFLEWAESRGPVAMEALVQEVLEQLRIDMKFMMFDLEATRRERDAYRRQLEEGEKEEDGDDHFFD